MNIILDKLHITIGAIALVVFATTFTIGYNYNKNPRNWSNEYLMEVSDNYEIADDERFYANQEIERRNQIIRCKQNLVKLHYMLTREDGLTPELIVKIKETIQANKDKIKEMEK